MDTRTPASAGRHPRGYGQRFPGALTHDLIALIRALFSRAAHTPHGRHRRPVPDAVPVTRRQFEGLTALLAVASPVPSLPVRPRRSRRSRIPVAPAPVPITMDDPDDPRRYNPVRPVFRAWERTRPSAIPPQRGEFAELASLVREALALGGR